jgi:hypothetical protein
VGDLGVNEPKILQEARESATPSVCGGENDSGGARGWGGGGSVGIGADCGERDGDDAVKHKSAGPRLVSHEARLKDAAYPE